MREVENAPPEVLVNPRLLGEALSNILDNAITYAGAGRRATVSVQRTGDQVCSLVVDDGPGTVLDFRGDVFDRVVRATELGAGCGLGLSIIREVVLRAWQGRGDRADHAAWLQVIIWPSIAPMP